MPRVLKKNLDLSLTISLFAGFMMGLFAPMELYLSNKYSFFFSGRDILVFAVPVFCAIFIFGAVILQTISVISDVVYDYVVTIAFALLVFVYVQGNFDRTDYGVWDGSNIDWGNYVKEKYLWMTALLLILVGSVIIVHIFERTRINAIIKGVAVCIILVQIVTLGTLIITKGGIDKDPEYLAVEDGEDEFSDERNIIILVLDSYDGIALSQIIEEDEDGYYTDILSDFTFYPDTSGVYSYTNLAIPHIITGEKYYNDMPYGEYLKKAYSGSKLLSELQNSGWKIGIYSETMFPEEDDLPKIIDNCRLVKKTVTSHVRLAEYIYRFVAFRYLPQPLKRLFVFYPDDIESKIGDNEDGYILFGQTNDHFAEVMQNAKTVNSGKCFKLLHIFGAHPPYHLNADNTYSAEETTQLDVCKANLELVDSFLNKLRSIGAYDNSTIIICSDHGVLQKRQNPMFLIKYQEDEKEFDISETAFSYDNLQNMLCELVNGENGSHIEELIKSLEGNDRIYLKYSHDTMNMHSYCQDIEEYCVNGPAYLDESLIPSGQVYGRWD